ncbi:MAG: hypothetical protein Ct9H300mP16_17250 [Pseudomonadota bacterium]|nr:MAG: hypothetical protein Ct9H300mP16_17250 [Pseudomonadota bacterium]
MITTKNYRDILHIGRHQRPEHYSIMQEVPWQDRALVRRQHRLTASERIAPPTGEVLTELNEDEVCTAIEELKRPVLNRLQCAFFFPISTRHMRIVHGNLSRNNILIVS